MDHGFGGVRGFHQRAQRLGEVLAWWDSADGDDRATRWTNRSARIAVPERAARACIACLRAAHASSPAFAAVITHDFLGNDV